LKILHIVPSYKPAYKYGGPIASVSKLCELLIGKGTYIKVLTTTGNGNEELDVETEKEHIVDGVPTIYFKRYTRNNTFVCPDLWKYLEAHVNEYDVVHIHTWWNILVLVSAWICYQKGAKVIISPRGMLCDYIINGNNSFIKKCIHLAIGKRLLKKSYFHATSDSEYADCEKLIPGWKGFISPNILPLTGPPIQKKSNDVFTMIFLSRIDPKKGLEFVLNAMPQLPVDVKLKICGTGNAQYIAELKELAQKNKIDHQIEWLEWQSGETKFRQLMEADLCVLTSYNENFGNVIVESLYMGTPVLITEMVGLSTFVKKYDLGWIAPLDTSIISDTISNIISDKEKRERINNESREITNRYFAENVVLNQYLNVYSSLLNNKIKIR